jgi:DNA-binding CsgD family transcriptional regulator
MAAGLWPVDRLADELAVLGARGLARDDYFREVAARLRRVVGSDATCWHTLDPQTQLITSDAPEELISSGVYTEQTAPVAGAGIIASEYLIDDVNTFAGLARRRIPVATLSATTRGRPERSTRYREVLAPSGIPFELRAVFVSRGRAWGAVHIARREDREDFRDADVAALARVNGTIAEGIRTSLRFDAARRAETETGPGMIVLGPHDEVELITPRARELLEEMRSRVLAESHEGAPAAVLALAGAARTGHAPGPVAVPGAAGWMTLHSSLPEGRASGRVAIVVDRAAGRESAALRLETYGVTQREREVAALLAQGCSNTEIAAALVVSPYTVQDHVKSLFEKTGVCSRRELVARIFLDDYLPAIMRGAPLGSGGGFAETV